MYDKSFLQTFYMHYTKRVGIAKQILKRPLTLTEKILYAHLHKEQKLQPYRRLTDYVNFSPDRVAMQDATAQMALLQFMNAGRKTTAVPSTVHCDHLIQAQHNAEQDLATANKTNQEVYDFLRSVSNKYNIGFWQPGAGIIHQVVLENYAFPGGMMVGTDSHTPNAGGLGMIAIGVGGADAVDVMAELPWELKMPKLIGVKLSGQFNGWTSAKDVILKLAGILTVKGGTNAIIEYFGEGCETLSATGKATICNMGAEVGATTSIFPYDKAAERYLIATGRQELVTWINQCADELVADNEVLLEPEKYYDQIIEIDLSSLEPYINGPFTPDAAYPVSEFVKIAKEKGFPEKMEVGLIGSCTNSSYEDLERAASIAQQAIDKKININAQLIINPGSEQVRYTAEKAGILDKFKTIGGVIMANACGPCIGQWKRTMEDPQKANSIVTSFNRNFAKRNDGNPNTHAFVASPDLVMAMTLAGTIYFNPLTDTIMNREGKPIKLTPPQGHELPNNGFTVENNGYIAPAMTDAEVVISPASDRLQRLAKFPAWTGKNLTDMPLLIKVKGKCTTDHISMAGPWLKYRGHLENISDNLLMGAENAFTGEINKVRNVIDNSIDSVSATAKKYKSAGLFSVVVAEENYGEGSSREHAAMEPRFLNVCAILVKSFARIHETNLKKQGMLALTFINKEDYDKVLEGDKISILGLTEFSPNKPLTIELLHTSGKTERFEVQHTYNDQQIAWFKAGSALQLNQK